MAKFVRFINPENQERYGIVNKEGNFAEIEGDIFTAYKITDKMREPGAVKILPPCMPGKIVAAGLNYRDHAREMKMAIPDEPVLFIKTQNTVIGHLDQIIYPDMTEQLEYEAELAIVIRNRIRDIDEDMVANNILGYTCLNDVTARDLQKKDGQWTRAKCFDTFAPIGPYIATDINPDKADIKLYLNDVIKQDSNTSNFIFKTRKLVSFISRIMTLNRGDIVTTGTPAGIGPMQRGDSVAVEIEGIGRLVNTVK